MESGKMAAGDSPGSRRAHSKYFMSLLDTESGCLTARKLMRAATVRERRSSSASEIWCILSMVSRIDQWVRPAAAICGLLVFAAMAVPVMRGQTIGFDLPVRQAIHEWASPALTAAMRAITMIGSEYFLVPLAAILVWRWERRGERRAAYLLVR